MGGDLLTDLIGAIQSNDEAKVKEAKVEEILKKGVDVNGSTRWGTPLEQAIEYGNIEIIKLLRNYGAKITEQDIEKCLKRAAKKGGENAIEKIKFIIDTYYGKDHHANSKSMKIINIKSQPISAAPAEYFTGSVHLTPLVKGEDPSCLTCACVSFDPSARSAWHTHPRGQLLIVTEGAGLIQEWGKPIQKIQKGDTIWTPPGIK